MGAETAIPWCDSSYNPWIGCSKISPGCENCFAEAMMDKRLKQVKWGPGNPRKRTSIANRQKPSKWNLEAEKSGVRRRVFCASLADVFDNEVPTVWREDLFSMIRDTPNLDWIILTKRIGNVSKMLPSDWGEGYPNVWLLMTAVNQEEYDRDLMKLLDVPAVVHGVSIEPQLGPINLHLGGILSKDMNLGYAPVGSVLDWIITGAESGHGARPYKEEWARSLRDQCSDVNAFFYKQNVIDGKKIETPELDGQRWMEFPK